MNQDAVNLDELLDTFEQAVEHHVDFFETAVSAGSNVVRQDDDAKLFWGDAAVLIAKQYGPDRVSVWASEIGKEKERIAEYRTVCTYYPRSVRRQFLQATYKDNHLPMPKALYSKFAIAKRFKDVEVSLDFIASSDPVISAEAFRLSVNKKLGKPTPAEKLADFETSRETAAYDLMERIKRIEKHNKFRIKLYEVK